jgi:uncharacterized protein DUF4129
VSSSVGIDLGFVYTAIEAVGYVALMLGAILGIPVVILFRAKRRRMLGFGRTPNRQQATWWTRIGGLVFALAILAAQSVLILVALDGLFGRTRSGTDRNPLPAPGLDPGAVLGREPMSLLIALAIIACLAIVTVALAIRWRLGDDAPPADADAYRRGVTAQAVEVSLDALRREPDPRRAIIAAYAAMERAMSRAGLGREPSEAPLEYLRRVLAGALASPEDARTMTHLFEVAKFSQHAVDEAMRARAIGALERIRTATMLPA